MPDSPFRRVGFPSLRPASFGAAPDGERLARMRRSPQFADGQFCNPVPAEQFARGSLLPFARSQFSREGRVRRAPVGEIPVYREAPRHWATAPASGLRLTWLGHSSVLAEIDGCRVLFDPVWGERCSPFTWAGPRRLHPVPVPLTELGDVDVVVISHDHYDHLDMDTVRSLARTGTLFAVPLGVGADLEFWGVPADRIRELDWKESTEVGPLTLTATPAQHFCGRGVRGPRHALWASWVVAGPDHRIYHSGDTGYFPGFARIGAAHGPFDATMIQVGAYSEFWPAVHMTPAEGMRAHRDLQGGEASRGVMVPIHWGTFNLAPHPWAEPAEHTVRAAHEAGATSVVPRVGEPFEPAEPPTVVPWWREVAVPPRHGWPSWPPGAQETAPVQDAVEARGRGDGPGVKAGA
ncbi:MBL fold metallo-hydrolase [Streptomyces sp. NPDC059740]|uniref:MBL fold metallo-hydrolase n=1 Tax=Streptomyces sp. NPDC059740 TaxID=3346926 RepID=UPI003658731E